MVNVAGNVTIIDTRGMLGNDNMECDFACLRNIERDGRRPLSFLVAGTFAGHLCFRW